MPTISSSSLKRRRARTSNLLTSDLYYRSIYQTHSSYFCNKISKHLSLHSLQFNLYPQIVSRHQLKITSLEIDNSSEGRFLLSGSQDCTISVYDLSLTGSDYFVNKEDNENGTGSNNCNGSLSQWKRKNSFRPIARSQRNFFTSQQQPHHVLDVPSGHSHSITQVKWYPVDSGIFLSSDSIGSILMWDTNTFTPVSHVKSGGISNDSSYNTCRITSMDLPANLSHMLLAIGSIQSGRSSQSRPYSNLSSYDSSTSPSRGHMDDRVVYLCDIKCGQMTHQLAGHGAGGIQVVQWSPVNDFILASGSRDGTVKLWDIRKSGSTSCLTTLDRGNRTTNEVHFQSINQSEDHNGIRINSRTQLKKKRKRSGAVGPSDYSKVECSNYVQSHAGPVSNLSFTPDGNHIISASCTDGLKLWDVQSGKGFGSLISTKYICQFDKNQRNIPLRITQPCNFKTATVWVRGRTKSRGYSIHGDGGKSNKVLSGHLDDVTAIAAQDSAMRLFTGSKDGMILGFGNRNEFKPDDT